jgi:hypothetical protein
MGGGERQMPIEAAEPYIWLPENQWISPVLEFGFEMLEMRHPKKLTQILHQEHWEIDNAAHQDQVLDHPVLVNLLRLLCQSQETQVINPQGGDDPWAASFCDPLLA